MTTNWIRSVAETAVLRAASDGPPDPTVFRRDDMLALVFCSEVEPHNWHLYLAVRQGKRTPTLPELMDARAQLLPNIEDFGVDGLTNTVHGIAFPVLHLFELPLAPLDSETN
jgi:hypothetical protein